jgi:hypothetical protein
MFEVSVFMNIDMALQLLVTTVTAVDVYICSSLNGAIRYTGYVQWKYETRVNNALERMASSGMLRRVALVRTGV